MTYTINGIETGQVLRIGELTRESFFQKPPSSDFLALEAIDAMNLIASVYALDALNVHVNHLPRGVFLHEKAEAIAAQISETGRLPSPKYSFEREFTNESLFDDEVLLMATFAAISMRGIEVNMIKAKITKRMNQYRSLQNFAIVSWTDILEIEASNESMIYLVDRIITEEKLSGDSTHIHPVLKESRIAYRRGDQLSLAIPKIEDFLVEKWKTGNLVVGSLPSEDNRDMVFAVVLPE